MQDAALRALQALSTVSVDRPKPWFLAIVRNAAMTFMARNRRKSVAYVGDWRTSTRSTFHRRGWAAPNPEQELIAHEDGERLRQAIAGLPSPFLETLVMRNVNGLSYREIAEATETPVGTVMSPARPRASHARQNLQIRGMTDRDMSERLLRAERRARRRTRRHGLARVRARDAGRSGARRRVPAPCGAARRRSPSRAARDGPASARPPVAALTASAPSVPRAAGGPSARWLAMAVSARALARPAARWRWPPPSPRLGLRSGVGLTSLRTPYQARAAWLSIWSPDFARAEISGQPFNVASSDRHTVKPWLAGRTTVSASIVDLAPEGFPLVGGRVAIVDRIPRHARLPSQ